eukprot:TRINITY_DN33677_c0_g1_i1.p1 TRINITY_DN33677_c0_g1~~TRINITY_DN33677_c0_g1_i1.p1  ORF type:complete len:547 (-),score=42.97 TRINITY_DN33677_c0_g1_i1:84-1724(-)
MLRSSFCRSQARNASNCSEVDAVVVGAGFGGLYALHRLRGLGLHVHAFESASGVGGTWFWNRYPGARCDIPSVEYSYQFDSALQQEWRWSERYAAQPEILSYIEHVAQRFDLLPHIQFNTTVEKALYDADGRWTIHTSDGSTTRAKHLIMALGCLSSSNLPRIPGIDSFRGQSVHTGRWPHDGINVTGKRVAVVGTGSSGVQVIPRLAEQASELIVFQRTPSYVVPARNATLDAEVLADVQGRYVQFRAEAKQTANGHHPGPLGIGMRLASQASAEELQQEYQSRWDYGGLSFLNGFTDLSTNPESNETAAEFVRSKIRSIVDDPEIAEKLCPQYPIGSKRLCVGTNYYETFNKPSVRLVEASAGIDEITEDSIRIQGETYHVDCIVYATGFDAITGPLRKIDIRGKNGVSLRDTWSAGPRTYLGLMARGFPNMHIVTGPGSPSVLTNMVPSIEQHVDFIASCLAYMQRHNISTVEPEEAAEDAWTKHVEEVASSSLRSSANSWYVGSNIPGKPRVFLPYLGGFPRYAQTCTDVEAGGYEGFTFVR